MTDSIIETKICPISGKEFSITQGDLNFYNKISPTLAGQKFQIPTPTLCPDERGRRRLSFRNERNLYKRKCDASGKDIISIYSPDKPYKVYDQKIRRSDSRDPLSYGQDFDFSKTFAENFRELMRWVPRLSINIHNSENCEYNNYIMNCKNCYMINSGSDNESCLYTRNIRRCDNCIDSLQIADSQNCSYITLGANNFNTHISYHVFNCSDSRYLYYCDGCSNCYLCYNLKNKKYCYKNTQYSKEEYEKIIKSTNHQDMFDQLMTIIQAHQNKSSNFLNNSGFFSGDFIRNSSNIRNSFNISSCEECSYCYELEYSSNCYDCFVGTANNSYTYESSGVGKNSYKNGFIIIATDNQNCYYCDTCIFSHNLFGCTGLRNKSYCIFNKQYTKEEYEIQVAKIITHMIETKERGEFFHPSLSPFGYNETVAQEYYPTDHIGTQILASVDHASSRTDNDPSLQPVNLKDFGYHRSDYQSPAPMADKIIDGNNLPTTINEVSDDILKTAIRCEITGKLFRIIPQELAFYRKYNLPLPRRHPDQRHLDRLALRK